MRGGGLIIKIRKLSTQALEGVSSNNVIKPVNLRVRISQII